MPIADVDRMIHYVLSKLVPIDQAEVLARVWQATLGVRADESRQQQMERLRRGIIRSTNGVREAPWEKQWKKDVQIVVDLYGGKEKLHEEGALGIIKVSSS